jgi:hypothetical protein
LFVNYRPTDADRRTSKGLASGEILLFPDVWVSDNHEGSMNNYRCPRARHSHIRSRIGTPAGILFLLTAPHYNGLCQPCTELVVCALFRYSSVLQDLKARLRFGLLDSLAKKKSFGSHLCGIVCPSGKNRDWYSIIVVVRHCERVP